MNVESTTLSEVHADLKNALEQDKRLRHVEVQVATLGASHAEMRTYLPRMEDRLIAEIQATKPPKVPWANVASALIAGIALVLVVGKAIYGG